MEQKQRPIILKLEDAKQELVSCINNIINNHQLNCYLIEPMITEVYEQIKTSARRELAQARQIEANAQQENVDNGAE